MGQSCGASCNNLCANENNEEENLNKYAVKIDTGEVKFSERTRNGEEREDSLKTFRRNSENSPDRDS